MFPCEGSDGSRRYRHSAVLQTSERAYETCVFTAFWPLGTRKCRSGLLRGHSGARKCRSGLLRGHSGARKCRPGLLRGHSGARNGCSGLLRGHSGAQNGCSSLLQAPSDARHCCSSLLRANCDARNHLRGSCSKKLCSVTLHSVAPRSALPCSVHGYARVHTSIYIYIYIYIYQWDGGR